MSLPVVTRPAAAAEFETAYRWYEKEREDLGSEFLDSVEKRVQTIAENPERFLAVRKDIRRAVLRRFPYSIFYRISLQEMQKRIRPLPKIVMIFRLARELGAVEPVEKER